MLQVGFAWTPQQVSGVFPIVMATYLGGAILYYSPYLGYKIGVAMEMDGLSAALVSLSCVLGVVVGTPMLQR